MLQPYKRVTQSVAEPTAVRQPAEQNPTEQLPHSEARDLLTKHTLLNDRNDVTICLSDQHCD